MWIFRSLLIITFFAAFVLFAIDNTAEKVSVNVPWGPTYANLPLMFALLVAFVLGMFVWFIFSLIYDFRMRSELRRSRKESDRLRDELKAIRNLPMQDIAATGDVLDTEEPTVP